MLNMESGVVTWLIGWSCVGSTLGFFTIRNKPQWTKQERFKEYIKSVSVGIFFAFPTCTILTEKEVFGTALNVMLAGSVAFAVTDVIINLWPRLMDGISVLAVKVIERFIGKPNG